MSNKPKKEVKKTIDIEGKLLEMVIIYNELNEQKKHSEDKMKPLKLQIIKILNNSDAIKAKNQIYDVNLSHIKERRLSEKKLKEELFARGEQALWESCLYDSEYDRLTVKKRKGGENIF